MENGRLGAMIYGRPWHREGLFLRAHPPERREHLVWIIHPPGESDALKTLPRVQQLLLEGKITEAEDLADTGLTATPRNGSPYQSLGELVLTAPRSHAPVSGYRRTLDLAAGISEVSYSVGTSRYQFQSWASTPDEVLVFHIQGPPEGLDFHAYLRRRPFDGTIFRTRDQIVGFEGQAGPVGVQFAAAISASARGGSIQTEGQSLRIRGARSVTIVFTAWTSFRKTNPRQACLTSLRKSRATTLAGAEKTSCRAPWRFVSTGLPAVGPYPGGTNRSAP